MEMARLETLRGIKAKSLLLLLAKNRILSHISSLERLARPLSQDNKLWSGQPQTRKQPNLLHTITDRIGNRGFLILLQVSKGYYGY